jgi:hypothetical protein
MEGGVTILLPLALSKKARKHLIFLQLSEEITMCMANAFQASFKDFLYTRNLKFNSTMSVSTLDLELSLVGATFPCCDTVSMSLLKLVC